MAESGLDPTDFQQLADRGLDIDELERQLESFRRGFAPAPLVAPATPENDGIEKLDPARLDELHDTWSEAAQAGRLMKFVPASGAATRMFRFLEARAADPAPLDGAALDRARKADDPDARSVARFFDELDHFAFATELRETLTQNGQESVLDDPAADRREALETLLSDRGLGYATLPKGLIPFHRSDDGVRTAFAEQLDEARDVVADARGACHVHFTVAPEFRARIEGHCAETVAAFGQPFTLRFSQQEPATDTVAVDLENRPLRDEHGRLVFRPGGHGALLRNLDELDADVVLIKNIDNVVPAARRDVVVRYQRWLTGLLVERQRGAHRLLARVEADEPGAVVEAMEFVRSHLHRTAPSGQDAAAQRRWLRDVLARPIRVCGMVRNEGEPGGGPFWVRGADGGTSLQIVESSQIDHSDPEQERIFRASTHFNPVDLVCAVRGPDGRPLDLPRFVDPEAGFISRKSKDGRELKALERPGLWNGAMAHWNTIFVEVPLETFNPVKTVLDLLRPAHQPVG